MKAVRYSLSIQCSYFLLHKIKLCADVHYNLRSKMLYQEQIKAHWKSDQENIYPSKNVFHSVFPYTIKQCALPCATITALRQLVNLGTRCTATHCRIALWSHQSSQTASSNRAMHKCK